MARRADHHGAELSKPASVQFPNTHPWPVKPPDEHWLKRWHWLYDQDGELYLADWTWQYGWHWGWSGKPDPEDMTGWTYVGIVKEPKI